MVLADLAVCCMLDSHLHICTCMNMHAYLSPHICMPSRTLVELHSDAVVPVYHLKAISVYYCKHFQHREYFKDNSSANYFQMVNVNIFEVLLHRLGFMHASAPNIGKCTFMHRQTDIHLASPPHWWTHRHFPSRLLDPFQVSRTPELLASLCFLHFFCLFVSLLQD